MATVMSINGGASDGGRNQSRHMEFCGARRDGTVRMVESRRDGADHDYVTTKRQFFGPESRVGPVTGGTQLGDHTSPRTYVGGESRPSHSGIGEAVLGALLGLYFGLLAGFGIAVILWAILVRILGEATYIPGQTTAWDDYRFGIQLFFPAIVWGLCALGGAVWAFLACFRGWI